MLSFHDRSGRAHFFSKKHGFATTLCDLRHHRVFDVVKGHSARALSHYLDQLPGKENVRVICMDLSGTYRSMIRRYFPNAKIVSDRFHVIRQINHQCLQAYQQIDPKMRYQRGLLATLRTRPDKLTEKRRVTRQDYFEKQPVIQAIDDFKQRLHELLIHKSRTAKQCRRLIPRYLQMVAQLKYSPFNSLKKLGKTLYAWREEIVRMALYKKQWHHRRFSSENETHPTSCVWV